MKSQDDIDLLYIHAAEKVEDSESAFPSSTYEEGVLATLEWLMGCKDKSPLECNKILAP